VKAKKIDTEGFLQQKKKPKRKTTREKKPSGKNKEGLWGVRKDLITRQKRKERRGGGEDEGKKEDSQREG